MWFLKQDKKLNQKEVLEKFYINNRDIILDNLTPQNADMAINLIRMWNTLDDKDSISFAERKPIKVYMSSTGGDLDTAKTIKDAIVISRTPVYTINTGKILNEAIWVYLAGHKRFCYPTSSFVFTHNIRTIDLTGVDQNSFYNVAAYIEKEAQSLRDFFIEKTKVTEKQYDTHKLDWYLNADDAYKIRVATAVTTSHSL